MPILLSHNSALERLRAVPPQLDWARRTQQPISMADVNPTEKDLASLDISHLGLTQRPIHHLVSQRSKRRWGSGVKSHVCSLDAIPSGLLYDLKDGCFAAGPELAFIQMASQTSLLGAVVLGYELCGSYSHFFRFASGFYERPHLTTKLSIGNALDRLKGLRGRTSARKALAWVQDGSASPMETVVSCMLNLPVSTGGFGLKRPVLNHSVTNDEAAQRITGTKTCKIDNAYPDALCGVEFDGKDYHRDIEKDRKRREALSHLGWTIYVFNVDELTDYDAIKAKVALLDKVGRMSYEKPSEDAGKELLARLLKATRFGVGFNSVLFGVNVPKGKVRVHI